MSEEIEKLCAECDELYSDHGPRADDCGKVVRVLARCVTALREIDELRTADGRLNSSMTAAELSNLRALAKEANKHRENPSFETRNAERKFQDAANPTAILALIAEIREPTKHKAYWYGMFLDREKERDEARELAFKWRGLWLEAKCWTVNDVMRFSWEESARGAG